MTARHDLTGRSAIVTGSNRGLGLEIARALGTAGARVLLCGRDSAALEAAVETLAGEGLSVAGATGDISRPDHAEQIVRTALERFGSLQVLVNNAGILGPTGVVDQTEWSEWVRTIEVNLLGSVLMARAVLPHFRAAGYGKIVQLSGGGATAPRPYFSAYAASKTAVVRFAETLAHEVRDCGIDVNAIAPGALNTRMLEELIESGPQRVGVDVYQEALRQRAEGGASLQVAADLSVYLCSSESDGITGRLISAVWDEWQSLGANKAVLEESDLFTLRRIVPDA